MYASKPQLKRPAPAAEEVLADPGSASADTKPAAAPAGKKTKAAAMAERVAASATTVVDGGGPGGSGHQQQQQQQQQQTGKQQAGNKKQKRPKKFIRTAGGQVWEDRSLHDWDQGEWQPGGTHQGWRHDATIGGDPKII